MLKHKPVLPPEHIYPVDDWRIIENRLNETLIPRMETVFAIANGYLGIRGTFEEGRPVVHGGTYVNGFHETWPILYGEAAYGFAKTGQTIVRLPDATIIRLYVDDEPFFLPTAQLHKFRRVLDMREGVLTREVLWETASGKQLLIKSARFVSFEHRHLAAISYELMALNAEAPVVLSSEIVLPEGALETENDPRRSRGFAASPLMFEDSSCDAARIMTAFRTRSSGMTLACGVDHQIDTQCQCQREIDSSRDLARLVLAVHATPGEPIRLTKFIAYHTSRSTPPPELSQRANWTLDRAMRFGFDELAAGQRRYVEGFWERGDVQIEGAPRRLQQCLRWNFYQMLQAAARVEDASVAAKGQTGDGYEGHYFWDTEVYMLPYLTYTMPRVAHNILRYRHSMLDKGRERARDLNQRGAMFPWRTISGDEASAYFAAGTAQYHINADIVYGLRKYVEITGDESFLAEYGAEILVETARMWADLGFYAPRRDNRFCINGVTGPDEYNTVKNNNVYTNLMARHNLRYAAQVVRWLREHDPDAYANVVHETDLQPEEERAWDEAADRMFIPFDERQGIHPQDDEFLDRKVWNLEHTPADRFPLMLYYHPLTIYRHQVLKQADVVLAMFLLGREFTLEQKRRNFDYYDPLTSGDSSLSPCIQSIVASEVGRDELAQKYFQYAAMIDLADLGRNVRDGVHVASIGGTWMALVYGFAGMRDYDGRISFDPQLPSDWTRLAFPLQVRGQSLFCEFTPGEARYELRQGEGFTLTHQGQEVRLTPNAPVVVPVRS
jgi:alpha,alpha-trehalose phosphorylase